MAARADACPLIAIWQRRDQELTEGRGGGGWPLGSSAKMLRDAETTSSGDLGGEGCNVWRKKRSDPVSQDFNEKRGNKIYLLKMQKSAVCVCLVAVKCLKETKYQTNNKTWTRMQRGSETWGLSLETRVWITTPHCRNVLINTEY